MTLTEHLDQLKAVSTNDQLHKATLHSFLEKLITKLEGPAITDGDQTSGNEDAKPQE
jgi:hypothetical protein